MNKVDIKWNEVLSDHRHLLKNDDIYVDIQKHKYQLRARVIKFAKQHSFHVIQKKVYFEPRESDHSLAVAVAATVRILYSTVSLILDNPFAGLTRGQYYHSTHTYSDTVRSMYYRYFLYEGIVTDYRKEILKFHEQTAENYAKKRDSRKTAFFEQLSLINLVTPEKPYDDVSINEKTLQSLEDFFAQGSEAAFANLLTQFEWCAPFPTPCSTLEWEGTMVMLSFFGDPVYSRKLLDYVRERKPFWEDILIGRYFFFHRMHNAYEWVKLLEQRMKENDEKRYEESLDFRFNKALGYVEFHGARTAAYAKRMKDYLQAQ